MITHIKELVIPILFAILLLFTFAVLWFFRFTIIPVDFGILGCIMVDVLFCGIFIILLLLYYLFVLQGIHAVWYHECFDRIGLINSLGRSPFLIRRFTHGSMVHLTFFSFGIALDEWNNKKGEIENALNITVSSLDLGISHRIILVQGILGIYDWSVPMPWSDSFANESDTLVLGEFSKSKVICPLEQYPHILLGGATGSGKTYLLKLLLYQGLQKNYSIYIADFKNGVDYPRNWKSKCTMAFNELDVLSLLNGIVEVLNIRLDFLSKAECKDITRYNATSGNTLPRIIFACDEVSELLDERGRSKEEKLIIQEISSKIRTIARLGRAAGIHLILATQRADADIISGQIKSNITYRVCGTADNMLSMITLDNTDASTMVPKGIPGVFLNHEGILFKSYIVNDPEFD